VASAFKLLALPVLVWLLGRYVFKLDPLWLTVATLNSALPAGANVYLVAQMYGIGVARATNAVVISTAASVFTLSIALLLLGVQPR
jgi:predicted permease